MRGLAWRRLDEIIVVIVVVSNSLCAILLLLGLDFGLALEAF
jgi:hypothetical protein